MKILDAIKPWIRKGTNGKILLIICFVGLIARIFFLIVLRDRLDVDVDAYLAHAETLLEKGGYYKPGTEIPTAYRPPLVPIFYAVLLWTGGGVWLIGLTQVLLGTATIWYGTLASWNLLKCSDEIITAGILAGSPILLYANCSLMTETLFTFLLAYGFFLATLLTSKSRLKEFLWLGIIAGLLALCRPGIWAFYLLLAIGWIAVSLKSKVWRNSFVRGLFVTGGLLLVIFPWALRNYLVMGSPIVMTTHGGYTLLLGNNDTFYKEVVQQPWGATWQEDSLLAWQQQLEEEMKQDLGEEQSQLEIPRDRWMKEQAYQWIQSNPTKFLEACWLRIRRFWAITPNNTPGGTEFFDKGIATIFVLFYIAAAIGTFYWFKYSRTDQRHMIFVAALISCIASFCLIHTVYWSNMRMRAPVEVCLAILASGAFLDSLSIWKSLGGSSEKESSSPPEQE
ncbi:MAG: hypothetical protein R3C11_29260 [Planctomycetaceae bacterium]